MYFIEKQAIKQIKQTSADAKWPTNATENRVDGLAHIEGSLGLIKKCQKMH